MAVYFKVLYSWLQSTVWFVKLVSGQSRGPEMYWLFIYFDSVVVLTVGLLLLVLPLCAAREASRGLQGSLRGALAVCSTQDVLHSRSDVGLGDLSTRSCYTTWRSIS